MIDDDLRLVILRRPYHPRREVLLGQWAVSILALASIAALAWWRFGP